MNKFDVADAFTASLAILFSCGITILLLEPNMVVFGLDYLIRLSYAFVFIFIANLTVRLILKHFKN